MKDKFNKKQIKGYYRKWLITPNMYSLLFGKEGYYFNFREYVAKHPQMKLLATYLNKK